MHTLKHKQDLFGGALFGAGIVVASTFTTTATADFLPAAGPYGGNNFTLVYGAGSGVLVDNFSASPDGFPAPQSYSGQGLDASAYAGTNLMGANITLTDAITWNYSAVVESYQWFTVESVKKVDFEWDLTYADGAFGAVYQYGVGYIYEAYDGNADSVSLNLLPGNKYLFFTNIRLNAINGGGFIRLSNVPAPPALALLGIGMFSARSRRRRE